VKAGQLNRRVTLQQQVETRDSYGGVQTGWADAGSYWARVRDLSAGEKVAGGQEVAWRTREFVLRNGVAVDERMRILYDGDAYDIRSVFRHPDRTVVQAVSGVTDGR